MSPTELSKLYEEDVYTWAMRNAELLRQGCFDQIDVEHIAEEIESVGKSEWRELENRLIILLSHLLKWQHQPQRRGRSWHATIKEQRRRVRGVLNNNPGLKPFLNDIVDEAYASACLVASREADLDEAIFPERCLYALEDALDDAFWPDCLTHPSHAFPLETNAASVNPPSLL